MERKANFLTGVAVGVMMMSCVGFTQGNQEALPTWQPIYVDGELVDMAAYNINGNNYVRLRDIGREVGFNVYWSDGVRVDSRAAYTGEPPIAVLPHQPAEDAAEDPEQIRLTMIDQINALRQEHGAAPLKINESLMAAAQECAEQHFREHDNRVECETVLKHGYPFGFGSNLTSLGYSAGTDIAARAVNSWRYSPAHYETMMAEDCDSIGVGVAVADGRVTCYMFAGCPSANNPYA